eukprot:434470-Rhodomonas_salina.4
MKEMQGTIDALRGSLPPIVLRTRPSPVRYSRSLKGQGSRVKGSKGQRVKGSRVVRTREGRREGGREGGREAGEGSRLSERECFSAYLGLCESLAAFGTAKRRLELTQCAWAWQAKGMYGALTGLTFSIW